MVAGRGYDSIMGKTRVIRVQRETVERAKDLSREVTGSMLSPGDVLADAFSFYSMALCYVADRSEGPLSILPDRLMKSFIDELLGQAQMTGKPTEKGVALAEAMPGSSPEDVQTFAVDVLWRMLEVMRAAGRMPQDHTQYRVDDLLKTFAEAVHSLSMQVGMMDREPREIRA